MPTEATTTVGPALAGLPGAERATVNEEGVDPLPPLPDDVALPIVFVHGFAGSAQQYESQAMRFVANGYPQDRIVAYDHDGAGRRHRRRTPTAWTEVIDADARGVRRRAGVPGRPLPGDLRVDAPTWPIRRGRPRSPSTSPSTARRAPTWCPASRRRRPTSPASPTSRWRRPGVLRRPVRVPGGGGARGGRHRPAAGPGRALRPSRQLPGQHRPGGRHARHLGDRPRHRVRASATSRTPASRWPRTARSGPSRSSRGATTSTCSPPPDSPVQHHLYLQPYVRSSELVRLLSSDPDGDTRANTNTGDDHSPSSPSACASGTPPTTPISPATRPTCSRSASDDEAPVERAGRLRRQRRHRPAPPRRRGHAGGDDARRPAVLLDPAVPERRRRVHACGGPAGRHHHRHRTSPRGTPTAPQTLNVPNWPSSTHSISVVFTDYPVD